MDILICPSCGIILRGKSKFCTGCGVTISKFSPTTLPVIAHTAAPLAVTLDPDPLVLERAMNRLQYASALKQRADSPLVRRFGDGSDIEHSTGNGHGNGDGHGNGHGNGNGNGNGNGHSYAAPGQTPPDASEPAPAPSQPDFNGAASASHLQSVLGNAASQSSLAGNYARATAADLVSFDQPDAEQPVEATEQPSQSPHAQQGRLITTGPVQQFAPGQAVQPFAAAQPAQPFAASQQFAPAQPAQPFVAAQPAQPFAAAGSPSPVASAASAIAAPAPQAPPQPTDPSPAVASEIVRPKGGMAIFPAEAGAVEPAPAAPAETAGRQPPNAAAMPATEFPAPQPPPMPAPPGALGAADFFSQRPTAFGGARQQQSNSDVQPANVPPPWAEPAPPPEPAPAPLQAALSVPAPANSEPKELLVPPTEPSDDLSEQLVSGSMRAQQPPEYSSGSDSGMRSGNSEGTAPRATPKPKESNQPDSSSTLPSSPSAFDFFAATAATPQLKVSEPEPKQNKEDEQPQQSSSSSFIDDEDLDDDVPSVVANAIRAAAASQTGLPTVKSRSKAKPDTAAAAEEPKEAKADDDSPAIKKEDDFANMSNRRRRGSRSSTASSSDKPKEKSKNAEDKRSTNGRGMNNARQSEEAEPMLKIGSFEMPRKMAISVAILVVVIGIPGCMLIFGAIGSIFSSLASSAGIAGGGTAGLSGQWKFGVLDTRNRNHSSDLIINQQGGQIAGIGQEDNSPFKIVGSYQPPKVQFTKYWVDRTGQPIKEAKPITFVGQVDWVNPQPSGGRIPYYVHMSGVWQLQKRVGYGWRGRIATLSNKWEGALIKPDMSAANSNINLPASMLPPPPSNWFAEMIGIPHENHPEGWAVFFMRIAGILLLLGMCLVFASVKMFGPNGLLNIWAKKKYIPSQFQAQHMKMVRQFGKPLRTGGLPLGRRVEWNVFKFWEPRDLAIPPDVRAQNPHMLVLGAGSKGKSRLLASMIAHDIESNDRAVVVVDSDGALVDLMMAWIASHDRGQEFARRLVIIDPTHGTETLAYNPLEFPDDGDLQNAASAVVFGFKAIYAEPPGAQSQWNQQTADILRNSAVLLMANGKTLTDLPVLLSENDFRDVLLEKVERQKNEKAEYTALVEAWSRYKRMARTDQWINWIEPILNRVNPMLGDPRIRPILTKPKGDLNLKEIISEGKILFVKVPQGQLDQNANLLGSLLITGLKQAALSLSLKSNLRSRPCALYLDEFDNFIEKETFDTITSETKKFQIGFIGASKTLQGLPEDYRNQIIINVGTMACFALAKKDGDLLGPQMFRVDGRKVKHQTLQNIFNKVNTAPQFELISDEEKLNIDRVVGQEERTYFCYRVGTVAGVFHMKSPEFKDIPDRDINWTLVDQIYARSVPTD